MLRNELLVDAALLQDQPPPANPRFNLSEPRSHCPACKATVCWYHNIPLLSYIILQGRCSNCSTRIPLRYPLVEVIMGLATIVIFWQYGLSWEALFLTGLSMFLLALAAIDMQTFLLPDQLTLPGLWLGLFASLFGYFTTPTHAIIGAIAGYGVLWLFYWAYRIFTGKEGIGYGDFKLLALLGAWFGWQALPFLLVIAASTGSIYGVVQLIRGQATRNTALPFGPFIALAGWVWLSLFLQMGDPFTALLISP